MSEALGAFRRGELARARALLQTAIGIGAAPAEARHLLGLIDCREGRMDSGISHLRDAAEAEPANVAFLVMLVRALNDAGRASEALAVATPPREASPAALALWHARAEAAQAVGNHAAAAEAWQVLTAARPNDWRGWLGKGQAEFFLDQAAEAEHAYQRAIALAPTEHQPVLELGSLYERDNRLDELDILLDQSLDRGVDAAELAPLVAARELRRGNADAARLALASGPLAQADPVRWHRLSAKVADADGDPAAAFEHSNYMNRATDDYNGWRKRAADYRAELRAFAQALTPEWAARLPAVDLEDRPAPAFLVGFPRSGTTLLDTFLMGHPQIAVLEERGLVAAAADAAGPPLALPEVPEARLAALRDTYDRRLAKEVGDADGRQIIDKAPLNMLQAPLIQILFGRAPIIFAQRHPCDCVLSGFMQSFKPNLGMASFLDIEDAADFYDAAMQVWTASCAALPLKIQTVVYEALVGDAEATLAPLAAFLGLPWDATMLDHRQTARDRGPVPNPSSEQIVQPLSNRAAGRWRRYERELAPVLPVLLPWARRLGYDD